MEQSNYFSDDDLIEGAVNEDNPEDLEARKLAQQIVLNEKKKTLTHQEEIEMQTEYAKIRRAELEQGGVPDPHGISKRSMPEQAQHILKEWASYSAEQKFKFAEYMNHTKNKPRMPSAPKNQAQAIHILEARHTYKDFLQVRGTPFSVNAPTVATVKEGHHSNGPVPEAPPAVQSAHYHQSVGQICRQVDITDHVKKLQKIPFKRKTALDRFIIEKLENEDYQKTPNDDLNQILKALNAAWNLLSPFDQDKYSPEGNKSLKLDECVDKQLKKAPIKYKIKFKDFPGTPGLKLTGFIYYAQKMRQQVLEKVKAENKLKGGPNKGNFQVAGSKMGELSKKLKEKWDEMSDKEQKEYDEQAEMVNHHNKCRQYQSQTFGDKMYA